MLRVFPWILICLLFVVGCSSGGSDPKDQSAEGEDWKVEGDKEKGQPVVEDRSRTTLSGRWQLMTTAQQPVEFPFALIDISLEGKTPEVQLAAQHDQLPFKMEMGNSKVDQNSLSFTLKAGNQGGFSFEGSLKEGVIVGNITLGPAILPARLIATKATSLKSAEPSPLPDVQEFMAVEKLKSKEERLAKMQELAEAHPQNPIALEIYHQLVMSARTQKLSEEQVRQLIDKYVSVAGWWGARLQTEARINATGALIQTEYAPDVALALIDEMEQHATSMEGIDAVAKELRKRATKAKEKHLRKLELEKAQKQLAGKDAAEQQAARESLAQLVKAEPYNPGVLDALAGDAAAQDRKDEAINYYSQLAVLFPLLDPMAKEALGKDKQAALADSLAALWKEKHGSSEGLDAHLNDVYQTWLYSFAGEKAPPRETEGVRRTVLIELFTGGYCPPCVAADIAVGGIETAYDRNDVVALRYHQHVPGPDQLANDDTETRFSYYLEFFPRLPNMPENQRPTPTTVVDGKRLLSIGGYPEQVPGSYEALKEAVSKAFEVKTSVTLKLSAEANEGQLSLSAQAEGLPEDPQSVLRMRMVLAEAEIPFVAPNGVRVHEMVVRSMPGSPKGIASADEGTIKFARTMKLDDFRRRLSEYLAGFEEQNPKAIFKEKPLDLKKLYFVAFVQNDQTREILQAAAIPVSGTIEYGKGKAAKSAE